jgi:cytochrome d ubiquinol oxidase subunit I
MIFAAYLVTAFVMAGVYAVGLLRGRTDRYHRLGFRIPFVIGAIFAPVQAVFGDMVARQIEVQQPTKYAAMEYVARTHGDVTEWIGGIYYNGHVYFGLGIPYLNSLFLGYSPHARVIGWDSVPPDQRAPLPTLIHLAFDVMVMIGVGLVVICSWQAWWGWFHRRILMTKWFLIPMALAGLGAIAAMESGWIVTEVGRQPWVVYRVLRTSDAVTSAGGVPVTLVATIAIYLVLTGVVVVVPWVMSRRWRRSEPPADGPGRDRLGPVPAWSREPVG